MPTDPIRMAEKVFVGRDAWLIFPHPDLLLWFEGDQIRMDKVGGGARDVQTGEPVDVPIYLHPSSLAWEQAAQMADEEDD